MRSLIFLSLFAPACVWACGSCAGIVDSLVYGRDFALNLVRMLGPIVLIMAIALAIHHFDVDTRKGKRDG